jgi:hypothetical protein
MLVHLVSEVALNTELTYKTHLHALT